MDLQLPFVSVESPAGAYHLTLHIVWELGSSKTVVINL